MSETVFPVGELTKPEVRELAKEAGLATHSKPESQDICFVSGSVQDFLIRIGGKKPVGKIITREGKVLSNHEGIDHFTVGQRRGLKIGGHENPLYVLEIDPYNNTVIVGEKHELERSEFTIKDLTWVAPYPRKIGQSFTALAQLRHRHRGVKVQVTPTEDNTAHVKFYEEWSTVSPGQACVFYDLENEEVYGGGRIVNG